MSHSLLFRHHAGRMPGPSRWYLAVMAMLVLMLLAAHFAVQAHAQKVMRHAVHAWLMPLGGEALQVRYRLLRGALTILDMRIRQGQWKIYVPRISLHTSTSAMVSEAVHFSRIRLDSMHLSLPRADLKNSLHGKPSDAMRQWFSVINDTDELILANGTLHFSDENIPWRIRKISGHITMHDFDLSGNTNGASLRLHGKRDNDSMTGRMKWRGMSIAGMVRILGLKNNMHGNSRGLLNWHANWPQRHLKFDSDIKLADQPNQGSIHIQGETSPEKTAIQTKCRGLALADLGTLLPAVKGRHVKAGILNGDIQLEQPGDAHWIIGISGEIHDIQLAAENLPAWTVGSIVLDNAVAQFPAREFHAKRIHIRDMDMVLQPGKIQAPASPWQLQVASLRFENVRPSIQINEASHRLILPLLNGSGHMENNGYMELDAASEGDEIWHITGKGHGDKLFRASIQAENVPLVRLRPLLPHFSLPGSTGPLQLSGNSHLRISLQAGHDNMMLSGQAILTGVMAAQGGDTFMADSIHIDIQQAGIVTTQHISSIRMNGWHYQAALHPIPRMVETEAAKETEARHRKRSWQVDEVTADHGIISVGSEDAVWANHASFSLKNIRSGTWSPLAFNASVGGGRLRIRGRVNWLDSDVEMKLHARLRDALPFFLNNWLMISSSPRLIRGRLDGTLSIKPAHAKHNYTAALNIALHQGQFESGAYPRDPMLPLTGYSMQELLDRLGKRKRMNLHIPYRGNWHEAPFSIRHMGLAALKVIRRRAPPGNSLPASIRPAVKAVSHVRLQHGRAFSHNEHERLWQVVKALRKQPKLVVELLPQPGHAPLDENLISRIRHTQTMIEYYMHARGIARHRIYPVWPVAAHRRGEITGIKIVARMP